MGALCSKSSSLSGGHTLIDSQSASNSRVQTANTEDRRAAVAEAAERRRQSEQARGVNSSNPKSGQLSKQLEGNKSKPSAPEGREEEPLVWD